MSYQVEFHGSFFVEDKDDAKSEGLFVKKSIERMIPNTEMNHADTYVKVYDFNTHTYYVPEEYKPVIGYRGSQAVEAQARGIFNFLIKNGSMEIAEDADTFLRQNDYFRTKDEQMHEYNLNYRELFVALKEHAKDQNTFKDDFKNAVSDVLTNEAIRGVSFK